MKKEILVGLLLLTCSLQGGTESDDPEVTLQLINLATEQLDNKHYEAARILFLAAITSAEEEQCPMLASRAHLWVGFLHLRLEENKKYSPLIHADILEHLRKAQRLAPDEDDIQQQSTRLKALVEITYAKKEDPNLVLLAQCCARM